MNENPFAQEQKPRQNQGLRLLDRLEAMERLRLKPAHFSKVVSRKIKGLPPVACVRIGRRQLFRLDTLEGWTIEVEAISACKKAH